MDSWQDLPLGAKAQVRSANLDLKNLALKKTKPFSPESQPDPGTYLEVKCNQPKHLHKTKKERRGQGGQNQLWDRADKERRLDGSSGAEQEMSRQLWDRAEKKVALRRCRISSGTEQER